MRPRVVIVKFLNYVDKFRLMNAARSKYSVITRESWLSLTFLPSCSSAGMFSIQRMKELASLPIPDLQYGIVHPAKLLVTFEGKQHIFNMAPGAGTFVGRLGQVRQHAQSTEH